jgi:hypothetical protein
MMNLLRKMVKASNGSWNYGELQKQAEAHWEAELQARKRNEPARPLPPGALRVMGWIIAVSMVYLYLYEHSEWLRRMVE